MVADVEWKCKWWSFCKGKVGVEISAYLSPSDVGTTALWDILFLMDEEVQWVADVFYLWRWG